MNIVTKVKDWAKGRVEGYLVKKGVAKAVAGTIAGAIALWASLQTNGTFLKVQVALDWLKAHGLDIHVTLDQAQLENTLTVLFTGLAIALINFLFRDTAAVTAASADAVLAESKPVVPQP